jgi:hypothetical protein
MWCATTSSLSPRIRLEEAWVQEMEEHKRDRKKEEEREDTSRYSVLPRIKEQRTDRSREGKKEGSTEGRNRHV